MNFALQQAIYSALIGNASLVAAVQSVRDKQPDAADSGDDSVFPYIVIGEGITTAWATDDWSGGDATVRVNVFSRYGGNKEALQIMDLVRTVLDRSTLAITGYKAVTVDFVQSFVQPDPDGRTRDGVIEFRVLICP